MCPDLWPPDFYFVTEYLLFEWHGAKMPKTRIFYLINSFDILYLCVGEYNCLIGCCFASFFACVFSFLGYVLQYILLVVSLCLCLFLCLLSLYQYCPFSFVCCVFCFVSGVLVLACLVIVKKMLPRFEQVAQEKLDESAVGNPSG